MDLQYVEKELSRLQAADGEEKSHRHRFLLLRQVRLERLSATEPFRTS
jgi:hypothetical protein